MLMMKRVVLLVIIVILYKSNSYNNDDDNDNDNITIVIIDNTMSNDNIDDLLYEIKCLPYEIFVNAATSNDVLVIAALTPAQLQMA